MFRNAAVVLAVAAAACGGSSPTGPSPSLPPVPAPPAGQTHTLAGRVTDAGSGQPVSEARVQFMTGVNAGRLASTGVDGRYSLSELRAGPGLVRVYGPRHAAVDETISVPVNGAADFVLTATTPGSTAAPFTYRGTIWDSRGDPVGGAAVSMIRDSAANPLAVVTTGADGTFTITTQSTARIVRVTRDGHLPVENPAPPPLASTTVVNVTLPRITRYALQAIQPLRVGQSATLTAEVETDDGLTSVGRAYVSTTSSDEGVIAVTGLGAIVARAPGTATITAAYSGLTTALSVQVVP